MNSNQNVPENWMWLIEIAIGLAVIIVLSLFLKKIVSIIRSTSKDKEGVWRKKFHKILHMPMQIAIWGFGLAYVIDVIGIHYGLDAVAKYVRPLKSAFIVSCLGWVALRWIKEVFKHIAKRSEKLGVAPSTIYGLSKLTTFVITILFLLIIFQIFNLNIIPLLAFGGIGVAGIAFAAQDFIANFFGGAVLHFTRSFSIGDQIMIPSKEEFRGIVKEIGWYVTVIEDYYRRPVYFPNALFSKTHLINESRRTHRRVKETITLRYDDLPNVEKIVAELREKISAHPEVDPTESMSITFSNYGEYGIEIYLYFLVYKMSYIKYMGIKQELLLIVQEVVNKFGAEFCYPTHNIKLSKNLSQ